MVLLDPAGSDGAGYQFIFRRTTTDTAPTSPTTTAAQRRNDAYVPTGWSDDPTGVDATNLIRVGERFGSGHQWCVGRIFNASNLG